jgi:hypothetical protein
MGVGAAAAPDEEGTAAIDAYSAIPPADSESSTKLGNMGALDRSKAVIIS